MREEEETGKKVASVGDEDLTGVGILVRLGIYSPATLEGGFSGAVGAPLAEAAGEGGWVGLTAGRRGKARRRPTLGLGWAGSRGWGGGEGEDEHEEAAGEPPYG